MSFNSKYAQVILDLLFSRPFISAQTIIRDTEISNYQTAGNLIKKFIRAGLLKETAPQIGRGTTYVFAELLEILEQDADPDEVLLPVFDL